MTVLIQNCHCERSDVSLPVPRGTIREEQRDSGSNLMLRKQNKKTLDRGSKFEIASFHMFEIRAIRILLSKYE